MSKRNPALTSGKDTLDIKAEKYAAALLLIYSRFLPIKKNNNLFNIQLTSSYILYTL